jgi:hypothetical protein
MAARAGLRASDADRERVVESLRDHAAAGRLDVDELAERTESALRARTLGELDLVVRDLPASPGPRRDTAGFAAHLRVYLAVISLLVAIWALTGMGHPWPVWPALGWGIGLAAHGRCGGSSQAACRMAPAYPRPSSPSK